MNEIVEQAKAQMMMISDTMEAHNFLISWMITILNIKSI